jgi:hypothetical protein
VQPNPNPNYEKQIPKVITKNKDAERARSGRIARKGLSASPEGAGEGNVCRFKLPQIELTLDF